MSVRLLSFDLLPELAGLHREDVVQAVAVPAVLKVAGGGPGPVGAGGGLPLHPAKGGPLLFRQGDRARRGPLPPRPGRHSLRPAEHPPGKAPGGAGKAAAPLRPPPGGAPGPSGHGAFFDVLADEGMEGVLIHLGKAPQGLHVPGDALQEEVEVSLDQVQVSGVARNDRHTAKYLFLLGANDHVLPTPGGRGTGIRGGPPQRRGAAPRRRRRRRAS